MIPYWLVNPDNSLSKEINKIRKYDPLTRPAALIHLNQDLPLVRYSDGVESHVYYFGRYSTTVVSSSRTMKTMCEQKDAIFYANLFDYQMKDNIL
ncbi:hypothetical protein GJ496_009084 [Pomphorhynchus laevis]|nr:hypothetical protein GJ496_009084 [Pomphorhynchus laevis]